MNENGRAKISVSCLVTGQLSLSMWVLAIDVSGNIIYIYIYTWQLPLFWVGGGRFIHLHSNVNETKYPGC